MASPMPALLPGHSLLTQELVERRQLSIEDAMKLERVMSRGHSEQLAFDALRCKHDESRACALLELGARHGLQNIDDAMKLERVMGDAGYPCTEQDAVDALRQHDGDVQRAIHQLQQLAHARPPPCVVETKLFSDSAFLAAYDGTRSAFPLCQVYELLPRVHQLIREFARSKGASSHDEADRFFNLLQSKIDSREGQLSQLGLAATRVWSSSETLKLGRQEYEFSGILNTVLRQDDASASALRDAAAVTRAINYVCVRGQYTGWPDGPHAVGSLRRSDVKDTTFRGGGIKRDLFGWFAAGKRYRTNMFVASSFKRSVAEKFEIKANASATMDPIMWTFKFEHEKCLHVNFLRAGSESTCAEYEFLLAPGTVLTVEEATWSSDVKSRSHRITVRVAPDNVGEPLELPLSPWC